MGSPTAVLASADYIPAHSQLSSSTKALRRFSAVEIFGLVSFRPTKRHPINHGLQTSAFTVTL